MRRFTVFSWSEVIMVSITAIVSLAAGCGGGSAVAAAPAPITADQNSSTGHAPAPLVPGPATGGRNAASAEVASDQVAVPYGANINITGVWKGTEVGRDKAPWTFTVTAKAMVVTAGDMELYEGTYTINPETNPMRLTAMITSSNMKEYIGKASNAVFKLEGNTLTLAANEPGDADFPRDFSSGVSARVFNLSRAR